MIGQTVNAALTLRKLPVLKMARKMGGMTMGGAITLVALLLLDAYFPFVGELFSDPSVQSVILLAVPWIGGLVGGWLRTEDVRRFLTDEEIALLLKGKD